LLEKSKIFCGIFLYRLEIYQPIKFKKKYFLRWL